MVLTINSFFHFSSDENGKVFFPSNRLPKKSSFPGCSKRARCKAPEILCRERIYAFPTVLQRLALLDNTLVDLRVYQVPKYVALLSKN
jgi:hypothetical protein